MKSRPRRIIQLGIVLAFAVFVGGASAFSLPAGERMGKTFANMLGQMLGLLPCAFILIALFDVWVSRETVERHFGKGSGIGGYFWGILLAGMTVGGLYLAFPVACSLFRKGAKLSVILAYVSFAGICRIPMTMFEVSFMGGLYTAVRLAVSIPMVIIASHFMGRILERRGYAITE